MIDFDREGLAVIEEIKDVIDHPNADRLDIVEAIRTELTKEEKLSPIDQKLYHHVITYKTNSALVERKFKLTFIADQIEELLKDEKMNSALFNA